MRLLVTGASGLLGGYLLRETAARGHTVIGWSGPRHAQAAAVELTPVELADPDAVAVAFRAARPDGVLHAAAISSVAQCFQQPERARLINVGGTRLLMDLAAEFKARLLLVSTDLVFDGRQGGYGEHDTPSPLSRYGQTKLDAEQAVLGRPRAAVVRVSLLYGPTMNFQRGFFDEQLSRLRAGRPSPYFADEWRTPLALSTAAQALVALVASNFEGLLHLGGPERMSRWEMGQRLAVRVGCDTSLCLPVSTTAMPTSEARPRDTSLDSSGWRQLAPDHPWPTFEGALREMGLG